MGSADQVPTCFGGSGARFNSFDELNARLEDQCLRRKGDTVRGHAEPIADRLMRDLDALMVLPPTSYDACEKVSTRATAISMVRYRSNEYSVPVAYTRALVSATLDLDSQVGLRERELGAASADPFATSRACLFAAR